MKFRTMLIASVIPAVCAGAMAQTAPSTPNPAQAAADARSAASRDQSMQKLQQSAQHLRESIQALARKQPGPDRDRAIADAHEALLETQRAMAALPPELRGSGAVSTTNYDTSVSQLMKSADSLRKSIQAMAQQPPGERRDRAIAEAHKALRDTQSAMLSAYQPATARAMGAGSDSGAGGSAKPGTSRTGATANTANTAAGSRQAAQGAAGSVVVLVPSGMAADARFADGCWVRFFDDKQFSGAALTLAGPVEMPKMEVPGALWRNWDSAIVGPRAHVTTFDNENFHDRTAELSANQSYPDLRDRKLGWFEEVKSARVSCG